MAESSSLIDGPAFHAHPDDPAAGARAFRQAIDAVMQGIKVADYAEEHEELKTALTKCGGGRTRFKM